MPPETRAADAEPLAGANLPNLPSAAPAVLLREPRPESLLMWRTRCYSEYKCLRAGHPAPSQIQVLRGFYAATRCDHFGNPAFHRSLVRYLPRTAGDSGDGSLCRGPGTRRPSWLRRRRLFCWIRCGGGDFHVHRRGDLRPHRLGPMEPEELGA